MGCFTLNGGVSTDTVHDICHAQITSSVTFGWGGLLIRYLWAK